MLYRNLRTGKDEMIREKFSLVSLIMEHMTAKIKESET